MRRGVGTATARPSRIAVPRNRTQLALIGALALGLAIVLAATGAVVPSRPALGASTTLSIIGGLVEVRHADAPYVTAAEGEVLERGDAVRTGADGRAVLTYFDGSTVSVEPSSEIVIEEATIGTDGSTTIEMTQVIGHTWHVVERQLSSSSKYEIHTNAATAVVRGTTFEVLVETDEADGEPRMTIATTKGTVAMRRAATLTSAGEEVLVPEGNEAAARRGQRLETARARAEAERVVTVTVGSERSVVVDPLGRANGFRDGKLVLETPGAKVERIDGKLVITMPNLPEGRLNAQVERGSSGEEEVAVETRVKERGRDEERAEERARVPAGGRAALELDVRRGQRPEVRVRPENARPTPSATPTPTGTGAGLRLPTVPPLASPTDAGGRTADRTSPARTAVPRTPRPRSTGVPSVQLSPLPTFAPTREPERGNDRGNDRGNGGNANDPGGSDSSKTKEPSRFVPDVQIPRIPGGLGGGRGQDR